ncbi:GMC oxidoreductase [Methylorubrum salsuginis]|uniref:Choline dehydrogenase n=1 Tax=Methylorubrum salsuginis TaxID=414703 RepID=A0A1I4MVF3_9HYPH|nr:GMC oxidoreductase [Methylorubrum salsuginis]SFM07259.1 Choline dehydrogenase [Methylorubrum salsuginis]
MSDSLDTDVLIIGAGFAGRAAADRLGVDDCLVLDRGETMDPSAAALEYASHRPRYAHVLDLSPTVEAERRALQSSLLGNSVELPLTAMSCNVYSYMQGGISNWWGGYASRLSDATYTMDGVIAWPIGTNTLNPYLIEAERALRVHGDPRLIGRGYVGTMPGHEIWSDLLGALLPSAHATPEAKNLTRGGETGMGLCVGIGHCAICANDAKARPDTCFAPRRLFSRTRVHEIIFEGTRAVSVLAETDGETFEIGFERLIVAAGGLENVALLRRSALPSDVSRDLIGRFYQDHTACELLVEMPFEMPWLAVGAEAHVEIPELSGYFHGIEVKTVLLTVPIDEEHAHILLCSQNAPTDVKGVHRMLARTARFYLQMEIPPEWDLRLRTKGERAFIDGLPYLANMGYLDLLVQSVIRMLRDRGLETRQILPHYRDVFGGHHYSGTTPMSRTALAVVDENLRLIGTDNVFISGASVIPRCGGAGPTLTLTALGLRLGDYLANSRGHALPTASTTVS